MLVFSVSLLDVFLSFDFLLSKVFSSVSFTLSFLIYVIIS